MFPLPMMGSFSVSEHTCGTLPSPVNDADDLFADSTTVATLQAVVAQMQVPFVLRVVEGDDVGLTKAIDASHPTRFYIGKSESCALQLSDVSVSRRHVACEVVDQNLRVTDLDSTNGTQVEGVLVGQAYLKGGERIRIGGTAIDVSRGQPALATSLTAARHFGSTLGGSHAMRRLYPLCEKLAASDVPVIIEGATGTGKESLAESLASHESTLRWPLRGVRLHCGGALAHRVGVVWP